MRKHLMLGGAMALLGAMTPAERAKGRYMRAPDDHKTPQQLALETKQHFDAKVDAVKAIAEDALGKITRGEALTTSVKELADQAISGMNEAKGRLDELEQKIARQPGNDDGPEVKSYGQQLAESERLKAYMTAGGQGNMKLELKAITSAAGSAGGLIVSQRDPGITDMPKRPDVILRDLVTVVPTTSASIDYAKQTARTNNAAAVAEGTTKPYSNYTWARISTPVRTLAHLAKLTRQAMDDAPQLQGEIDSEMRYGLAIGEDQQILLGDGLGENLLGLMPQATPFALPVGAIAPGTSVDKLRAAVLQSTLALYAPTAFVLNPIDWYNIEISKNGQGNYLFANPLQMAGPTLWGRPVAATVSMAAGSFLTGDFKRAATLYDRMTVEVLISSENSDDFEKNLYTMRAEERLAMAVKRPAALIKGTFDAPQA